MSAELARLHWRCRRGMLELDLLLAAFLDHGYGALDVSGRESFAQLLDLSDQALHEVLLGIVPAPEPLAHVVAAVRAAAAA